MDWPPAVRPSHYGGPPAETREMTGVVDWDDGNQHQITDQFIWQHTPSVLEVRLSLENLWVDDALLSIIHDTNEKANYENAPIRKISSLEIGKQAVGSWKRAEQAVFQVGASKVRRGLPERWGWPPRPEA